MGARFVLAVVLIGGLAAQPPRSESVFARVCRWLGLDPKLYSQIATRGGDVEPAGQRVMRADLQAKRVEMLWSCGECWSPILLEPGAAGVAKSDGIWRVPLDRSAPTRIVDAANIAVLVGIAPKDPRRVLALVTDDNGAAETYSPRLADLSIGRLTPAPAELGGVYQIGDLAAFPRPDEFRNERLLSTSQSRPLRMLVATYASPTRRLGDMEDLLPWAGLTPLIARFRPIWVTRNSVLFLERDE